MVKRAILSVSDKTGIVELARRLAGGAGRTPAAYRRNDEGD